MNLYKLTTEGLGVFYAVANSPNDAQGLLMTLLDKADYGFYSYRQVINIELLAKKLDEFPVSVPNFSSGNKLIIQS